MRGPGTAIYVDAGTPACGPRVHDLGGATGASGASGASVLPAAVRATLCVASSATMEWKRMNQPRLEACWLVGVEEPSETIGLGA